MLGPVGVALTHAFFYDPSPEFGSSPTPFVVLFVVGFLVGILGHLGRSRTVTAIGIGMVFLATFLLPLAINISKQ